MANQWAAPAPKTPLRNALEMAGVVAGTILVAMGMGVFQPLALAALALIALGVRWLALREQF